MLESALHHRATSSSVDVGKRHWASLQLLESGVQHWVSPQLLGAGFCDDFHCWCNRPLRMCRGGETGMHQWATPDLLETGVQHWGSLKLLGLLEVGVRNPIHRCSFPLRTWLACLDELLVVRDNEADVMSQHCLRGRRMHPQTGLQHWDSP
jgi:hypothetical protein